MENLKNTTIKLSELVKNIEKGKYSIPCFQRDFVWKKPAIEDLGDSLIRSYPIASFLFMPSKGSLQVKREPLKVDGINKVLKDDLYVLDGQQRMTSIAKIFLSNEGYQYYFDLASLLKESFPEDDIASLIKKAQCSKTELDDRLCKSFKTLKNKDSRQGNRMILCQKVLNNEYMSDVMVFLDKILKNKRQAGELRSKYLNEINKYFTSLLNYEIQATEINEESDLGLVCRVFEKINSTGVKLRTFDLINANSFYYNENGISSFFEESLLQMISDKPSIEGPLKYLFEHNGSNFENYGRIIRILMIADLIKRGKTPGISNSLMLKQSPEFWEVSFKEYEGVLKKFLEWGDKENFLEAVSKTYLEYIIGVFCAFKSMIKRQEFLDLVMKKGLEITLISNASFNKSNISIIDDFASYAHYLENSNSYLTHHDKKPEIKFNITRDSILQITKGQSMLKNAIFCIMYYQSKKHKHDLYGNKIKKDFKMLSLIPEEKTKEKPLRTNSIANFVPIFDLNIKTNDASRHYSQMIYDIKKEVGSEKFLSYTEENLIPSYRTSDKNFIESRANLIADYLNSFFNKGL